MSNLNFDDTINWRNVLKFLSTHQNSFIEAGNYSSYFIDISGHVYACGDNSKQQLGIQGSAKITTPTLIAPLQNEIIVSVSAGDFYSLYLTLNGEVYGLGYNYYRQISADSFWITTPIKIDLPEPIVAIKAGANASYFLTEDGKVYIKDYHKNVAVLFRDIIQVSTTKTRSFFLTRNGKVLLINFPYALSLLEPIIKITSSDRFSFFLTNQGDVYMLDSDSGFTPTKFDLSEQISDIEAGTDHVLFLTRSGYVWSWKGKFTDLELLFEPKANIVGFRAGHNFSLFIDKDLNVYGLGENKDGQLGIGNTINQSQVQTINFNFAT